MIEPQYISNAATGFMPGLLVPLFKSKNAEVRWKVRHLNLCALDRETRQAAAADPAIIWDATIRQYRFRRPSDPAAPAPPLSAAPEGCASVEQANRTADGGNSVPAPANQAYEHVTDAPDLERLAPDPRPS